MYYVQKQPPIFEDKFHFYFSYLDDSNKLAKGIGKFGRVLLNDCKLISFCNSFDINYNFYCFTWLYAELNLVFIK